jgi:hypothetical protein
MIKTAGYPPTIPRPAICSPVVGRGIILRRSKMTKQELFEKYHIDERCADWEDMIDNWMSVEIYRVMHEGELPPQDDLSTGWMIEFREKCMDIHWMCTVLKKRKDWGSLFLTGKRMIYRFADEILRDINVNSEEASNEAD